MKILYVEDEIAHVVLTQRTLEDNFLHAFELLHAETISSALNMLDTNPDIDLVLTDLRLPDGTGLDLLDKVTSRNNPPAVVLVTGQGDQENAVAALKAGAADYLVKQNDYLHRLPIVISNAIAHNRLAREQAALHEAEVRYQSLVEQTPAVVFLDATDDAETTLYISPRVEELTGFTAEEWQADPDIWVKHLHPDDRERITEAEEGTHKKGQRFQEEYRFIRRDGRVIWIKEDTNLVRDRDGNPHYWQGILVDITKEKESEVALQRQVKELTILHSVATVSAESVPENVILENTTKIISQIYPEVCGILLLNAAGDTLTPHPSYLGADVSTWRDGYPITEGITGKAVLLGKPLRYGDVTQEPDYIEIASEVRSELCVPIRVNERIIGVLNVESKKMDAFSEGDERFLNTIAGGLGSALERIRLFEVEQRRSKELESLYQGTKSLTQSLDREMIAGSLISILGELLQFDIAGVHLLEDKGKFLIPLATSKRDLSPLAYERDANRLITENRPLGEGIIGWVAQHGKPFRSGDAGKDPRYVSVIKDINSELCVPMFARDKVVGTINVETTIPNAYTERDENLLAALANSAAIALENARLYDETQRRLSDLETINRVSSSLRTTQSQDDMLDILLDETLTLLKAENGSIWLYDPYDDMIVQRAARGVAARVKHSKLKPGEGIIGHVFSSGKVHSTTDLANDPLLFEGNRNVVLPGFGGACIPIQSTAGTLGALMIQMEAGRQIADHTSLLTTLAEITGNSIHRADLFEQSQEQIHRLTTLRDIDSAIASSTDLRVTLNILTDHTLRHLKVDAVNIMAYYPELQSLSHLCSAGFSTPSPSRPLVRIGEGLAGQVVMKGRTDHVIDLKNSSEAKRNPMILREGFVTYIGVPLMVKGQIKGVFEVFHRSALSPNAEWMQFLQTLAGQAAIAIDNSQLFDNLQRSNQELTQAYDTTLEGWARALELRDRETEGHTRRVTDLTLRLAHYMGISEDELVNIYRGVLLHDIGKMGVPDHILKKTSPLTDAEWSEMRLHPQYAFDLLSPITYLRSALDIPYCHHEHWDGSGYPRRLIGDQIPLSARIFSVVDIWDALLSDRPYRKAWSRDKVIDYIKEVSGTILDPKIVDTFLTLIATGDSEHD